MERLFHRLRRLIPPGIDGGRARIAIALFLVVGASALFWASRDYGVIAPEWDGQVRGIAYSPSHVFNKRDGQEISPEQIFISSEMLRQINAAIDSLPPKCKLIFLLVKEGNLKYREVAELLNLSVKTVEAQMSIALKKISHSVPFSFPHH